MGVHAKGPALFGRAFLFVLEILVRVVPGLKCETWGTRVCG